MKPQRKVTVRWSPSFSYIIGIIATDGNLSPDERHIVITSKDSILLENIKEFLNLTCSIGTKSSGTSTEKKYSVLQIGDAHFYDFLLSLGLTQNKSKTLGKLKIPKKYFLHFLRGCIDGDGNIDVFTHKESSHKQLRIRLASASSQFLEWIFEELRQNFGVGGGWIYAQKNKSWEVLTYGKQDSIKILNLIYKNKTIFLERKFNTAKQFL